MDMNGRSVENSLIIREWNYIPLQLHAVGKDEHMMLGYFCSLQNEQIFLPQ